MNSPGLAIALPNANFDSLALRGWSRLDSTRRTAGSGSACPVVWQGRAGNRDSYADISNGLLYVRSRCPFAQEQVAGEVTGEHDEHS